MDDASCREIGGRGQSSTAGSVTLIDRFSSRGRDSLRVRYVISPGVKENPNEQKNTYPLNNRLNADGSWHIDSHAMPDW